MQTTYLAVMGRQSLELGGYGLGRLDGGRAGEVARGPAGLGEQRKGRQGPLGLALVLDGLAPRRRDAVQVAAGAVRVRDALGRVALHPGLVRRVVRQLVLVRRVLEALFVARCD